MRQHPEAGCMPGTNPGYEAGVILTNTTTFTILDNLAVDFGLSNHQCRRVLGAVIGSVLSTPALRSHEGDLLNNYVLRIDPQPRAFTDPEIAMQRIRSGRGMQDALERWQTSCQNAGQPANAYEM